MLVSAADLRAVLPPPVRQVVAEVSAAVRRTPPPVVVPGLPPEHLVPLPASLSFWTSIRR